MNHFKRTCSEIPESFETNECYEKTLNTVLGEKQVWIYVCIIILYYTALYYTVLKYKYNYNLLMLGVSVNMYIYTVLYCTVLYYVLLYYVMLFSAVVSFTTPRNNTLYFTMLEL